ncbi:phage neck terminator protein [Enterobacter ludwigii]|uniref:phage neck terminator protein n=1 Tax=Enterobacter ludwigii TaxID=299767 RepID=UPI003BEF2361
MLEIVNKAVGIPNFAFPMYVNAPRPPADNYAAVRCKNSHNPGFDEVRHIDKGGKLLLRTSGVRILTFDILFVREGNEIVNFDNAFFRPDVKSLMRLYGFAGPLFKGATNLSNADLESNWEIRRGITCEFNVLRTQTTEITSMSDAQVRGTMFSDNKIYTR